MLIVMTWLISGTPLAPLAWQSNWLWSVLEVRAAANEQSQQK